MQEALALKADSRDSSSRQEIQEFLSRVESMQQEFEGKLDSRGKFKDIYLICVDFEGYEEVIRKRLDEHQSMLV